MWVVGVLRVFVVLFDVIIRNFHHGFWIDSGDY